MDRRSGKLLSRPKARRLLIVNLRLAVLALRQEFHFCLQPVFQMPSRWGPRSSPKLDSSASDLVAREFNIQLVLTFDTHSSKRP